MTFIKKFCFECGKQYLVDDLHPHKCVMEDDSRTFTLQEIRTVIREELSAVIVHQRNSILPTELIVDIPRPACDGDIFG